ncbi:hypothetical protein BGW38_006123 [Lunasporangiospora selenospora]|uniref:Alpha-tubulin suppressor n=1 Tax=Lunasporangiospora selenospora TaxID=979761 RepID=A0A9P6KH52_9FUNG|nr:hypothetical protein BGW38_006123 [Lunasporangiospora selenospora]
MLRLGHVARHRLALGSTRSTLTSPGSRLVSVRSLTSSSPSSRHASYSLGWFVGAGVVFTGVTLLAQSPTLGLAGSPVYNDSPESKDQKGESLGTRLAGFFRKPPPVVEQRDIVLDTDLTVTSWKQQEQDALLKAPGIMLWGSNKSGIVDPTGKAPGIVQIPQRLATFNGKVLRDLKLGDDFAAAVDDDGNVYQWGTGFNKDSHTPEITLKNRDIVQVTLCDSKLYGLSKDGASVFVMPKVRPATGPAKTALEYQPPKASGGVWKIVSMASGKTHMLMLTSSGRVFGSEDGLSISLVGSSEFKDSRILEIACGEVHSLARDDQGRCWAWGVNGFGQLAMGAYSHAYLRLAQPTLIKDIPGKKEGTSCVKVAAGGQTSFFVIEDENSAMYKVKSAGMGQWGQLGDGTFTHIQGSLVTIGPLSNLAEYKEEEKKMTPIGIHSLAIGSTHAFAVLDNAVQVDSTLAHDTIVHGRDVFAWGQNTYFQLLTGKRSNKTEPVYALPLDSQLLKTAEESLADIAQGKSQGATSLSTLPDATNRLQLTPARLRRDMLVASMDKAATAKSNTGPVSASDEMVELKITAGNGVSAVYCGTI